MSRTRTSMTPEERRGRISALMLRGVRSSIEIAKALNGEVTDRQIRRDIEFLEAQYRERAAQDVQVAMGLDLMRIERMVANLLPRATNTSDRGQIGAARVVKELLERKARMLGYDQPEKIQQAIGIMDAREVPPVIDVSHLSLQDQAALDGLLAKALPEEA